MGYLEYFLTNFKVLSYVAVLVGIFLEGEVVFLTSAIFATEGYLNWGLLIVVCFGGLLLSDAAFYYLGRWSKHWRLGQWLNHRFSLYDKWLNAHLVQYYWQIAFVSKFLYFVNKATPFLAGWHNIAPRRFFKVQFFSGMIWLGIMLILGHFVGLVVDIVGVKLILHRIEFVFIAFLLGFFFLEKALRKIITRKIEKIKD
jgi:membrane protein DedA with SNARE-associated domain